MSQHAGREREQRLNPTTGRPPARPREKDREARTARAAEGIRLDHFLFTECT